MIDTRDLAGKVAIVTGSSVGIGAHLARVLGREGVAVVVNSRRAERLESVTKAIESDGGAVLPIAADVRDPAQVESLVAKTAHELGPPDILVNNAGGTYHSAAEAITPRGWDAVVDLNLKSAFLLSQAVFPAMSKRGEGSIVNLSSIAGLVPGPHHVHYNAAKAGLVHLTVTLALEWGRHGIRVNCLVPGSIVTDNSPFAESAVAEKVARGVPLGRIGVPDDLAGITLLLCSRASSFISGAVVRVDGGPRAATSFAED